MKKTLLLTAVALLVSSTGLLFAAGKVDVQNLLTTGKYEDVQAYFSDNPKEITKLKDSGFSALHFAVDHGNFDACRALIELGADINERDQASKQITNPDGPNKLLVTGTSDIIDLAIDKGNWRIVDLLLKSGVSPTQPYSPFNGQPQQSILDRAIDNWIDAFKANRELLNTSRSAKHMVEAAQEASKNINYGPSSAANGVIMLGGITGFVSSIFLTNYNQKKILSDAKIVDLIHRAVPPNFAIARIGDFLGDPSITYGLDTLPGIPLRDMALDFAVIIGGQDLLERAIKLNSQPTPMTFIYVLELDRLAELKFMNGYGYLPVEVIKRFPVVVDDEAFQSPLIYAAFKGEQDLIDLFRS